MLTTPWLRVNRSKEYIRNNSHNISPSYIRVNVSRDQLEFEITMEAFEIKIEGLRSQWKLLASRVSNLKRGRGSGGREVGSVDLVLGISANNSVVSNKQA